MSKRLKALAGAFCVLVASLLVIYAINVHETGRFSLLPTEHASN